MRAFAMVEQGSYALSTGVIVAENYDEAWKIAEEQLMFDESYYYVEEIELDKKGYTHLGSYME